MYLRCPLTVCPSPLGPRGYGKLLEQTFQIHKFIGFFTNEWTPFSTNFLIMQIERKKITFGAITVPHSSKFNHLSCNCRNYQIITVANCEYLWQIQPILPQIVFYSRIQWMPLQFLCEVWFNRFFCIIEWLESLLWNVNHSKDSNV